MTKNFSQCAGCPYEDRVAVLSKKHFKPDAVFVTDCPSIDEVRTGIILAGREGQFFNETISKLNIQNIYVTYAVLCYNNGDASFPKEVIKRCGERLKEELASISNDIPIVLMGGTALSVYTDMTSIMEARGFVYDINDKKVFCTVHPSNVLRKPSFRPLFELDIKKAVSNIDYVKPKIRIIETLEQLSLLAQLLSQAESFAWDIETAGFDYNNDAILCFSFSMDGKVGYVVPWMKNGTIDHFTYHIAFPYLKQILESPAKKIGQNLYGFDLKFTRKMGINATNYYFDTLIASHLVNENVPHDLNALITTYTNLPRYDINLSTYLPNQSSSYALVPNEVLWEYAGCDAIATFLVYRELEKELEKENLLTLFREISMPLTEVLHDMEWYGVLISKEKALGYQKLMDDEIIEITTKVYDSVGKEFNLNSVNQLRDVLYKDLKLSTSKKTAKNADSTSSEALEELNHPVAKCLLRYRELNKIKTTYLSSGTKGLLGKLDANNRVHPQYVITGTTSGRLSAKGPNIHQTPRNYVRGIFVAPEGYSLVESDYISAELMMVAYYSRCQALIDKFNAKEDVLKWVASLVFNKPLETITKQERQYAKYALYGICYGRGPQSLADQFGLTFKQGLKIIDTIFLLFPELKQYQNAAIKLAKEKGILTNVYGRKRRFEQYDIFYSEMERQAINVLIQGSVADTAHKAIIDLHREIKNTGLDAHTVIYIHDGIISEVRDDLIPQYLDLATKCMEREVPKLNFIMRVEHEVSKYWLPKQ